MANQALWKHALIALNVLAEVFARAHFITM